MEESESSLLVEYATKVDIQGERMDRHFKIETENFDKVFKKLDSLNDKIHDIEINASKAIALVEMKNSNEISALKREIYSTNWIGALVISIVTAIGIYFGMAKPDSVSEKDVHKIVERMAHDGLIKNE